MISIITPTHNTKHLKELEETIMSNTFQDWEWIVLLNNGAEYSSVDSRIKTILSPLNVADVGLLKNYACSQAQGEIIVEADHDDLLTDDCLQEVYNAFIDQNVGFVYSDNAKLSDSFLPYNKAYGWTHRKFDWKGKSLYAMNSQILSAGRLGYIWFAPDHVRAWRKSVYDKIGGHRESPLLCDDLDLMHRLYMVTKFHFIPKVLYIYRITGENTWLKKNADIQKRTVELYNENIFNLACRFAEINGLMKVDLCGGFNKPPNFVSIDRFNGDIIADLENGIPLPSNSVGVLRANDALEHIANKQLIMSEIHRVLIKGGILLSSTPSTDGRGAFQDPTHISFWNQNSFWYWTRPDLMRFINNKDIKFRECALYTHFPSDWHKGNNISYTVAHLEKL